MKERVGEGEVIKEGVVEEGEAMKKGVGGGG